MLEVTGLSKSFGALTVVDDVSVTVKGGEALGVMGPNGAGKSTFFDLLTGVTPSDTGRVLLDGVDISALSVEARVVAGAARAFQIPKQFASLTVREHLHLAATAGARAPASEACKGTEAVFESDGLVCACRSDGGQAAPTGSQTAGIRQGACDTAEGRCA